MCDFQLNWTIRNLRAKLLSIETCWDFFILNDGIRKRGYGFNSGCLIDYPKDKQKRKRGGKKEEKLVCTQVPIVSKDVESETQIGEPISNFTARQWPMKNKRAKAKRLRGLYKQVLSFNKMALEAPGYSNDSNQTKTRNIVHTTTAAKEYIIGSLCYCFNSCWNDQTRFEKQTKKRLALIPPFITGRFDGGRNLVRLTAARWPSASPARDNRGNRQKQKPHDIRHSINRVLSLLRAIPL